MLTESNTSHGAQVPHLLGQSISSIQLSISVSSNLEANQLYSAIITTISDEVVVDSNGTIEFSKFQVNGYKVAIIILVLIFLCF